MTNKFVVKPLAIAVGLALAAPALALDLSLKESNIYMKFLDGDRRSVAANSIDTASGGDQGQFTELNLQVRATLNSQVEAGFRVQSRSSAAYWSEFGFKDEDNPAKTMNSRKFMKLRGAYIQLTPGYGWLNEVRLGSSQWSMFDPFTVGAMRYIDRDNINGFYFRGKLGNVTWDAAKIVMPEYLGFNWGNGPVCCGTDDYQKGESVYIGQVLVPIGAAKLTASVQTYSDHTLNPGDTNPLNGTNLRTIFKNDVYMLKAEGSPFNGVDLKGAYYRSNVHVASGLLAEPWSVTPRSSINDDAYKLDAVFSSLPVPNLTFAYQYFNIGAGYTSIAAARRESDVLLTEGSEAAWYNWGNNLWMGGAAADTYQQVVHRGVDNDFMDFNEAPAERVLGWKGHTFVANYEIADTPMSLELTRVGYNNNWQNYNPTGPLSGWYALNQDRKTNIFVFKANHTFKVAGGIDTAFKFKWVKDTDDGSHLIATDDTQTKDRGYSFTVGKQLHDHLYGSIGYGRYNRDFRLGAGAFDTEKGIWSAKLAYSLGGFEFGLLSQWINGNGYPDITKPKTDFNQYRLKATAQATF